MTDPLPRRRRRSRPATLRRAALDGIGAELAGRIPPPTPPGLGEALIERAAAPLPRTEPKPMPTLADRAEGHVSLPRRLPPILVVGAIVTLGGQAFFAGTYTNRIENCLSALVESDQRLTARSEERYGLLTERLTSLERDRDRLPKLEERFGRIEEKMTMMIDLLRETRAERLPKR